MIRIYDFSLEVDQVRLLQEASLAKPDAGLAVAPLIGSDQWWREVQTGIRPRQVVSGEIARVYWGSMADWPEFTIRASEVESDWTREGEIRRYVEGLHARLEYVEHPYKASRKEWMPNPNSRIVLSIDIEESARRASGIAPGPGGMGFQLTRQRFGDVRHYLRFGGAEGARAAAQALRAAGLTIPGEARQYCAIGWLLVVAHRDEWAAPRWRSELTERVRPYEGTYDGGEIVGGEVWGAEKSAPTS